MRLARRREQCDRRITAAIIFAAGIGLAGWSDAAVSCAEVFTDAATSNVLPLIITTAADLRATLPADSHLLIDAAAMESFLTAVDETAPDWALLYGNGEHDAQLDERLFQINRVRDEHRQGRDALHWRVTFFWDGVLGLDQAGRGEFSVAVGPRVTDTRWGIVRFKPADLPSSPLVSPPAFSRQRLAARMREGEPVDITVAMTGRLIEQESVIYDFSHDGEGRGLIMPVVQVEQVQYLLIEAP